MSIRAGIAALACAMTVSGGMAQAQQGTGPKELPPAGFSANQFVDSDGCVFLRAGLGGQTAWVPRVGRDRKPVCGYAPTFPAGTISASAAAGAAAAPEPEAAPAATAPQATPEPSPSPRKARKAATGRPATPPAAVALVHRRTVPGGTTYCAERIDRAQRYLLTDGRRVTQCAGTAPGEGVAYLNGLAIPGLVVSGRAPTAREVRAAEAADRGRYAVTHVRGKLTAEGEAARAAPRPETAAAGPYVQIGAFAEPANAERAIAMLKRLGLPASVGVGGRLRLILAGPFASSGEVANALALVRQNGYRDAYATRG